MTDGGCCPSGEARCGATDCYNPSTAICCGQSGIRCEKGKDCMPGGGCCPSGHVRCGSDKCYDPKTSVCCADGTTGAGWGCVPGASCCKDSRTCYLPSLQKCCPTRACLQEESCCTNECCKPTSTCGVDGNCTPTPTPPPTTTKATRTCSTPTLKTPQTKTQTIKFVYDPNRKIVAHGGPSRGKDIPGTNDAVIMNMCDGIKKGNGGGNSMELTHGGRCFQRWNRRKMCRDKGISWCQQEIKQYIKTKYGTDVPSWAEEALASAADMTCDEFPFASSIEGGDLDGGVRRCVPADDNNWQGRSMSKFFSRRIMGDDAIKPGEKYKIEIVGWDCNNRAPKVAARAPATFLKQRDAFTNTGGVNRTGREFPSRSLVASALIKLH